jgi:hypothetical protein
LGIEIYRQLRLRLHARLGYRITPLPINFAAASLRRDQQVNVFTMAADVFTSRIKRQGDSQAHWFFAGR